METVGNVLMSSNGVSVAIIFFIGIGIFLFLGKKGFFSYKGKGLTVGRTESQVRAILLKQKEYLLQYCSYLTLLVMSDLEKAGEEINYIDTDYVIEKVVDEWLGWLLVNHVSTDDEYVSLKTQQCKLIVLKAVGRVNPKMLQNENLVHYFEKMCEKCTIELINGIIGLYKLEKKGE